MKNRLIPALIISFAALFCISASDSCLDRWGEFSHSGNKNILTKWMRTAAGRILYKQKISEDLNLSLPAQPECIGLFITLIRKGKVRGCYGAFNHRGSSIENILINYIKGALYLDPRHEPLERFELDDTEIVLTVTSNPEPVDDINNVDISNFGLLIECEDSNKIVIVPAEYKTASKVLKMTGNSLCRYHKFRGITIR